MAVQKNGVKKGGWKIYVIVLAVAIAAAGGFYLWMMFQNIRNINKYEEVLSGYFKFKAEENKEGMMSAISGDFDDELSSISLKGSGYVLYAYSLTDESITNKTNEVLQAKKITFGITLNENNAPVSYIGEAYLVEQDNVIKIHYIKKLFKGRNITRLWNKHFKV